MKLFILFTVFSLSITAAAKGDFAEMKYCEDLSNFNGMNNNASFFKGVLSNISFDKKGNLNIDMPGPIGYWLTGVTHTQDADGFLAEASDAYDKKKISKQHILIKKAKDKPASYFIEIYGTSGYGVHLHYSEFVKLELNISFKDGICVTDSFLKNTFHGSYEFNGQDCRMTGYNIDRSFCPHHIIEMLKDPRLK